MSETVPTPEEAARLVVEVLPRLMRVAATAANPGEAPSPLSITQFRILKLLAIHPSLVSELALVLDVSPPTVSVAIDSLVRKGLVARGEAADDRRVVPLQITGAGSRSLETAMERMVAALSQVLELIRPEERRALARALVAIRRAVEPAAPSELEAPERAESLA